MDVITKFAVILTKIGNGILSVILGNNRIPHTRSIGITVIPGKVVIKTLHVLQILQQCEGYRMGEYSYETKNLMAAFGHHQMVLGLHLGVILTKPCEAVSALFIYI